MVKVESKEAKFITSAKTMHEANPLGCETTFALLQFVTTSKMMIEDHREPRVDLCDHGLVCI